MTPLLQFEGLSKSYPGRNGGVRALQGISLTLNPGEFVSVQGPSGCGKTTLLLAAGGLLQPSAGKVLVNGQDLYALSPAKRAQLRAASIGFVFQQFHLIPYLDVMGNILAPTLARSHSGAGQRAEELIAQFGLKERAQHLPSELSTGERQRTALARALLHSPKLILADEPTGNLDGENAQTVLRYLKEFAGNGGGVLLVTHDTRAAAQFAQSTWHLKDGKLAENPEP